MHLVQEGQSLRLIAPNTLLASSGGCMRRRRATVERLGSFFRWRICSHHYHHGPRVEDSRASPFCRPGATLANCVELRSQLRVHRNCLDESSSPFALHQRSNAAAYLDQLPTSIYGVVSSVRNCMGCEPRLAAVPVFVYAAVFVSVELAYLQFEHHVLAHVVDEISHRTRRVARVRSFIALALF